MAALERIIRYTVVARAAGPYTWVRRNDLYGQWQRLLGATALTANEIRRGSSARFAQAADWTSLTLRRPATDWSRIVDCWLVPARTATADNGTTRDRFEGRAGRWRAWKAELAAAPALRRLGISDGRRGHRARRRMQ